MTRFPETITKDYARSSHLEWLLSNGLGGYSSSTVAGSNTRRYHGLLVAALKPPAKRTMLLQKLEETVRIGGASYRLSVNAYPGTLYPTGYEYLEEFRLDPFPVFRYRAGSVSLEKEVCLLRGENTVIIQYRVIESPESIGFTADILLNYRDFHSLTHEDSSLNFTKEMIGRVVKFTATEGAAPFHIYSDKADFESTGFWYRDFVYAEEQERGYSYKEDIFSPGRFAAELKSGDSIIIEASTSEISPVNFESLIVNQRKRVQALVSHIDDQFLRDLLLASDAFLVRRNEGASCIAGYHWFCDWGRDAMISLPGLALVPGRYNEAKLILETFAKNVRYGLIPNFFSEADGTPQYNSLDASLWFFHAARKYFQYTKDLATVRALYPVLKESVEYLSRGTTFDVKADVDMLLNIGQTNEQLTWMDAKIGDLAVTPRNGKPVEINALWFNALDTISSFTQLLGKKKESDVFANMAQHVRTSFAKAFWNQDANCLFDRTVNGKPDASIRPNQIIAVSLPKSILSHDKEKAVVEAVQKELLTPFGLRTLSPKDPNYKGRHEGNQKNRDLAYHQGPAWPWLLGRFIKAYIRVADHPNSGREAARSLLEPMRGHLSEAGVGFISELFDGDPPYRPRGCIAQAWSVAEVLRAYYEDVLGKEPRDPFTG